MYLVRAGPPIGAKKTSNALAVLRVPPWTKRKCSSRIAHAQVQQISTQSNIRRYTSRNAPQSMFNCLIAARRVPVLRSLLPQSGSTASFCALGMFLIFIVPSPEIKKGHHTRHQKPPKPEGARSYTFVPLYWDGTQDKKALIGVQRTDLGQRSNRHPFYFEYRFLVRRGTACTNPSGMKCRRVRAERHRNRRKGLRCPLSPAPYC